MAEVVAGACEWSRPFLPWLDCGARLQVLLSATITEAVKALAASSLHEPVAVDVDKVWHCAVVCAAVCVLLRRAACRISLRKPYVLSTRSREHTLHIFGCGISARRPGIRLAGVFFVHTHAAMLYALVFVHLAVVGCQAVQVRCRRCCRCCRGCLCGCCQQEEVEGRGRG